MTLDRTTYIYYIYDIWFLFLRTCTGLKPHIPNKTYVIYWCYNWIGNADLWGFKKVLGNIWNIRFGKKLMVNMLVWLDKIIYTASNRAFLLNNIKLKIKWTSQTFKYVYPRSTNKTPTDGFDFVSYMVRIYT